MGPLLAEQRLVEFSGTTIKPKEFLRRVSSCSSSNPDPPRNTGQTPAAPAAPAAQQPRQPSVSRLSCLGLHRRARGLASTAVVEDPEESEKEGTRLNVNKRSDSSRRVISAGDISRIPRPLGWAVHK